jgi:hypothetical protein
MYSEKENATPVDVTTEVLSTGVAKSNSKASVFYSSFLGKLPEKSLI